MIRLPPFLAVPLDAAGAVDGAAEARALLDGAAEAGALLAAPLAAGAADAVGAVEAGAVLAAGAVVTVAVPPQAARSAVAPSAPRPANS